MSYTYLTAVVILTTIAVGLLSVVRATFPRD